jgi:hypothetical protein
MLEITMSIGSKLAKLDKDIAAAQAACDKLNRYMYGQRATKSKEPTPKYYELNSKANRAVLKLPPAFRARFIVENWR